MGRITRRQVLISGAAVALCLAAPCARAQERLRVIGILGGTDPVAGQATLEGLRQGLADRGWVEGRNLVTKSLWARGEVHRLDALAVELVALKPDVILVFFPPTALAVQRATRDIPIVMGGISDPVKLGLVSSLSRPGGNITGTAGTTGDELVGKRLQLIKECFPNTRRLALMFDPSDRDNQRLLPLYTKYGSQLGIELIPVGVEKESDIPGAFEKISPVAPDCLTLLYSPVILLHRETIASRAIGLGLPTMASNTRMADAGALMAYTLDSRENDRQVTVFVDKILRGAKPSDLPVEEPKVIDFVINLKTAKKLGITIPPSLLLRATRVIE